MNLNHIKIMGLVPHFRYTIRFLPPSLSLTISSRAHLY